MNAIITNQFSLFQIKEACFLNFNPTCYRFTAPMPRKIETIPYAAIKIRFPSIYLIITKQPQKNLQLLEKLGFVGYTIPHLRRIVYPLSNGKAQNADETVPKTQA
jgi:hypothetical protein